MARNATSPWRYDRATVRFVLETEGLDSARSRWPRDVVDPIARVLGLIKPYNRPANQPDPVLSVEQVRQLGTKPDARLAGEWGLPHSTVAKARKMLAIPAIGYEWQKRLVAETLRRLSDLELIGPLAPLSEKTKLRVDLLAAERQRRGIRRSSRGVSFRAPLNQRRLVALRALRDAYPAITLEELAEVFGLTRERVRQLEEVAAVESGLHVQRPAIETTVR